jgi:hypothetical protein
MRSRQVGENDDPVSRVSAGVPAFSRTSTARSEDGGEEVEMGQM